jgi:hypothetical protein
MSGRGHVRNLIGMTFGTITVLSRADNDDLGHTQWVGQCKCGSTRTYQHSHLKRAKRCGAKGCRQHGPLPSNKCKRGHERTPENTYTYRGIKTCRECKRISTKLYQDRYPERYRESCRKAGLKWWKKQLSKNPAYRHNTHLKENYGISREDYDRMFSEQKGLCAICKNPPDGDKPLNVDHCHSTGKVRKLLCTKCNFGLGYFRDNISFLDAAAEYLKGFL